MPRIDYRGHILFLLTFLMVLLAWTTDWRAVSSDTTRSLLGQTVAVYAYRFIYVPQYLLTFIVEVKADWLLRRRTSG